MRKELTDRAEAMARQRAQQLGEELREAGLLPPDDDPLPVVLVREPGRHSRGGAAPLLTRVSERLPLTPVHLVVLVAVAAVVLVVVAWLRIAASSPAVPVPRVRTTMPSPVTSGATSGPASGSSSGPSSPGAAEVVVDVAGKVLHPGVLRLAPGSRVVDAIRKAGGARAGVDLTSLNLARVVVDGEQILVGAGGAPTPGTASGATAGATVGPAGGPAGTVSLNQASLEQLEALPGVGPVTAQKILDYRTAHGAFGSVDELLDVDGIGDKTLAELAPHLTL